MAVRGRRYRSLLVGHHAGRPLYATTSSPSTGAPLRGERAPAELVGHRAGRCVYSVSNPCTAAGVTEGGQLVGHRKGRLVYAVSDNCAFGSYGSGPAGICYNPVATQAIGRGVVISVMNLDIWYTNLAHAQYPRWNEDFWSAVHAMKGAKRYGYPKLWDDVDQPTPTVQAFPVFPYPFVLEAPLVMSLSREAPWDSASYAQLADELAQVGLIFLGTIYTPNVTYTDFNREPLSKARYGSCQDDPELKSMVLDWIAGGGVVVLCYLFESPLSQEAVYH